MLMNRKSAWLAAACITLGMDLAQTVEKKPLPEFQVMSSQGYAVSSNQLAGRRRWLLVLVSPVDPMADRLLSTFAKWPESRWLGRTTFLEQASAAEAREHLQKL